MTENNLAESIVTLSLLAQYVVFILKIGGVIDWNWIWVLSPLWIIISWLVLLKLGFDVVNALTHMRVKQNDKDQ